MQNNDRVKRMNESRVEREEKKQLKKAIKEGSSFKGHFKAIFFLNALQFCQPLQGAFTYIYVLKFMAKKATFGESNKKPHSIAGKFIRAHKCIGHFICQYSSIVK